MTIVIDIEVQAVERGQVERGALVVVADAVERICSLQDLQGRLEPISYAVGSDGDAVDQSLSVDQFLVEGFLLGPQILQCHGVGQVGIQELALLALDLDHSTLLGLDELPLAGFLPVELLLDDLLELLAQLPAEADVPPVVADDLLNLPGGQVRQVAVVAFGVPTLPPGTLDGWSWHQETGGEVVADGLGPLVRGLAVAARVEHLDVGVVEDVLELVSQGEALAGPVVIQVDRDYPAAAAPLGEARDR